MNTPPVLPDLELIKLIGSGSYGEVWLARTVTGMYRAVKIVDRMRFKDEKPWLREFAGISRFQRDMGGRPRQLALLHVGEDRAKTLFYYVMELADDLERGSDIDPATYVPATLKAVRERRAEMPVEEVIRFAVELTRSLAELHEAGLIHRDIKPSNIIYVQGVPKLADLGLVSSSEHTLTSLGTPGYSPPEGSATPRSDIFSLGRILYEMSMNLPSSAFPSLPPQLAELPDASVLMELNEVLLIACHPDPAKRYADAQALLKDLLHLQAGGSLREMARMREHLRRARKLLYVAAGAGLAIALVLGVRHYQALRRLAEEESAAHLRAEEDSRSYSYAADIHLARISAEARDFGGVHAYLQRQIPTQGQQDRRGPEWWALWNSFRGDYSRSWKTPGTPQLSALLWDSGSKRLLWQASTGERALGILDPNTGSARVLTTATWRLACADHRGQILTSSSRKLTDIDPVSGKTDTWTGKTGSLFIATPDTAVAGRFVGSGFELHLFDRATRTEKASWCSPESKTDLSPTAMDLGPRDEQMFLVYYSSGAIRERTWVLHDFKLGRDLWTQKTGRMTTCCAFSPDGKLIAVGGPGWVGVWEAKNGQPLWVDQQAQGQTDSLLWSPDGLRLHASGSSRKILTLEAATGNPLSALEGCESSVSALALDPANGRLYAADSSGAVTEFPASAIPGRHEPVLATWDEFYGSIAYSRDASQAAVSNAQAQLTLYSTDTWTPLCTWPEAFRALAPSADGKSWLALNKDNQLVRCSYEKGVASTTATGLACAPDLRLRYIATSPDGHWTAIGGNDGRCEIWDLQTTTFVATLPLFGQARGITAMTFSNDSSLLVVADDQGRIAYIPCNDWKKLRRLPDCSGAPYALACDNTRQWLAVGMEDGSIQIYDDRTRTWTLRLLSHHGQLSALALTHDGKRLISGGQDGLLIYTDTETWRQVGAYSCIDPANHLPVDITHALLDPLGKHLIICTGAGQGLVQTIAPTKE